MKAATALVSGIHATPDLAEAAARTALAKASLTRAGQVILVLTQDFTRHAQAAVLAAARAAGCLQLAGMTASGLLNEDIATMIRDMGFECSLVDFDSDGDEDDVHAWWFAHDGLTDEDMKSCMDRWNPTPPDGEGWILVSKHDTEDGPHALFVRPVQPPKGRD